MFPLCTSFWIFICGGREGERKTGREGGRDGGREGGRDGGRQGGREGGTEGGREGGREGIREVEEGRGEEGGRRERRGGGKKGEERRKEEGRGEEEGRRERRGGGKKGEERRGEEGRGEEGGRREKVNGKVMTVTTELEYVQTPPPTLLHCFQAMTAGKRLGSYHTRVLLSAFGLQVHIHYQALVCMRPVCNSIHQAHTECTSLLVAFCCNM